MPLRSSVIPLTLALVILPSNEGRGQRAPSAPPNAAALAAAHRVLDASGSVDAMVAAMRANLPAQRAATPQLPDEFWTQFEARIVKDVPQLVDSIAVVYARNFTLQELDALTAFYQGPVGRRLRAVQPTLITESSAIGQRWGMRIGAEIGASLRPK